VDVKVGVEEHLEKGWCLSKMRVRGAGLDLVGGYNPMNIRIFE